MTRRARGNGNEVARSGSGEKIFWRYVVAAGRLSDTAITAEAYELWTAAYLSRHRMGTRGLWKRLGAAFRVSPVCPAMKMVGMTGFEPATP